MNKVNIVALAIMCALPAHSQIIISETTEGSGNNKAIELTNISQENINLEQYTLRIAHNGAQDWSSSTLSPEESPNDFDKNHQVKVDTHLVI